MSPESTIPDPDYTGREDRVFQAVLLAPNLRFIRKVYGPEVEEEIYRVWGVNREEAADGSRWITYDTALALSKAMVEVTGDKEITYKAGLMHSETTELGPVFYIAKLLAAPRAVYARIPGFGKDLSKITSYKLLDIGDNHARLEFTLQDGYPDHPLLDAKRRGTLAAISMSFGLPPAEVTEETCMNRGDPSCIYMVRWESPGSKYKIGGALMVLGAVLGVGMSWLIHGSAAWWGLAGALLGLIYLAMHRALRRQRMAQDRMRTQEGEIGALEELARNQSDQASRLEVLRQISDLLHKSTDETALILTATELVSKQLAFARVLYWKVEGDRLVAASGAGVDDSLLSGMGALWLPLNPDTDGRDPDLPLFGRVLQTMKGRRIPDVAAFREQLTTRGKAMLDRIAPGPFVVVPVRSQGEGVGLLAAERREGGTTVTDADQSMLQQVANQVGMAMDNVRYLQGLQRQKKELEAALLLAQKYAHYLPTPVVDQLREDPSLALELGGKPIRATVLFSDIKGFTQWAKDRDPKTVVARLNRYFAAMDEVIAETGGILDKRMGDGLMVVFLHPEGITTDFFDLIVDDDDDGATGDPPQHPAERALDCAQSMQREVTRLAASDEEHGFPGLSIRIGVAHGDLVAGNLGSRHRLEYTVIGDVVNVASRLEQLCTPGSVFTTRLTLHHAGATRYPATPLGARVLKGREGRVEVLKLLNDEEISAMSEDPPTAG